MENPFAIGVAGWTTGLKLLVLALVFAWLYYRVTKKDTFLELAAAYGVNALMAFIFFSGKTTSAIGILLNALFFFAGMVFLNALVCSKIIYEAPKINFPRERLVDPDKGLQLPFTAATAFLIFVVIKLACGNAFKAIESVDQGLGLRGGSYILYLLAIAAIAYLTQYVIPWKEKADAFVTGEINLEPVDVFEVSEDISSMEKIAVPALFYFGFILLPYLMKETKFKSDADVIGVVLIGVVIAAIVRQELFKATPPPAGGKLG